MKNPATFILIFLFVYIYKPQNNYSQSFSERQSIEIQLMGGISFPSQPTIFTDYWNFGYNLGGGFGYRFTPIFSASFLFNYNNFPFNDDKFLRDLGIEGSGVEVDGGSIIIITVTAVAKARFTESYNKLSPYLVGGIGYFSLTTNDMKLSYGYQSETIESEYESAFSFLFGGGLEVPIGINKYFFIELNYGQGFTKEDHTGYIPLKIGFIISLN
jgi:opacity protein-like surface antigen